MQSTIPRLTQGERVFRKEKKMILRKVKIDGKEVFEKISFEDALNFKDKEDLVFQTKMKRMSF